MSEPEHIRRGTPPYTRAGTRLFEGIAIRGQEVRSLRDIVAIEEEAWQAGYRKGLASSTPAQELRDLVDAMPWKRWTVTLHGDWESGWTATAHSRPAGEAGITVESHESVWGYETIGEPTPEGAIARLRAALTEAPSIPSERPHD